MLQNVNSATYTASILAYSTVICYLSIMQNFTVADDGTVEVTRKPGLGFEIDLDYIKSNTQTVERIERSDKL